MLCYSRWFFEISQTAKGDYMNLFIVIGSMIGIGLQILLSIQILEGKIKQNFCTWVLWAILEVITAVNLIIQHGNFLLPALYSVGCMIVALAIIKSKNFLWTWWETFVACMALVCMGIWIISGSRDATIASTTAVIVAGFPLIKDCYKNPSENPFLLFSGFLIANALSTIGGANWSVEERLYPAACTVFTLLVVLLVARKFWRSGEIKS